jgi:hypothetical protein
VVVRDAGDGTQQPGPDPADEEIEALAQLVRLRTAAQSIQREIKQLKQAEAVVRAHVAQA